MNNSQQETLFDIEPEQAQVPLPTPRARDWKGPGRGSSLPATIRLLPTPQASDCHRQTSHPKNLTNFGNNLTLLGAVLGELGDQTQ